MPTRLYGSHFAIPAWLYWAHYPEQYLYLIHLFGISSDLVPLLSFAPLIFCVIGGSPSNITISWWVTQGSVFGPILFNLYTTPLSTLIANTSLSHHFYADNTNFSLHLFLKTSHLSLINFNPLSPLFPPGWQSIFSPSIHPSVSSCSSAYLSSYPKFTLLHFPLRLLSQFFLVHLHTI